MIFYLDKNNLKYRNRALNSPFDIGLFIAIGHFRIPGIGLELACNRGLCGGISLKRVKCNLRLKILPRISLSCKLVPVRFRSVSPLRPLPLILSFRSPVNGLFSTFYRSCRKRLLCQTQLNLQVIFYAFYFVKFLSI